MMIGTSGSGNSPGDRTVRTNSGPLRLGASATSIMPIDCNSARATLRMLGSSSTISTLSRSIRLAI